MTTIQHLRELGQSLWLDSISRPMLDDGRLQRYVTEFSALYDRLMAQPSFRHSWLGGSC